LLTDSLRRKPYSVVLLDEVEKAHADVFDMFLQLFDDGRLTDAHGKTVDGSGAIFIMTSNLGSELYDASHSIGFSPERSTVSNEEIVRQCKQFFRPEFINRIDEIVVFRPLARPELEQIVAKLFAELSADLAEQGIAITLTQPAAALLAEAGFQPMYGARPLRRTFDRLLVQPLAHRIVEGEFAAADQLAVTVEDGQLMVRKEKQA
jgi:ATP-dependent Clp protease ATP-binding subunit ClpB